MKHNRIKLLILESFFVGISFILIFFISITNPFESWMMVTEVLNEDNIAAMQLLSFLGIVINISAIIIFRKTKFAKFLFVILMIYFIYIQFDLKKLSDLY